MTFPEPRAHNHTNTQEEICSLAGLDHRNGIWSGETTKRAWSFHYVNASNEKFTTPSQLCAKWTNLKPGWILWSWKVESRVSTTRVFTVLHHCRNMQSTGAAYSDHLLACMDLEPSQGCDDAALKQKARWFLAPGGCRRCFWRFHQSVTHHTICHLVILDHHFISFRPPKGWEFPSI